MSKPHTHLQTMNKASAQFQKDQARVIGGVVLTKYTLMASTDERIDGQTYFNSLL